MQIQRRDETGNEKDTNFQIIENERSYWFVKNAGARKTLRVWKNNFKICKERGCSLVGKLENANSGGDRVNLQRERSLYSNHYWQHPNSLTDALNASSSLSSWSLSAACPSLTSLGITKGTIRIHSE